MSSGKPIIRIICGPTGVGKTDIALRCAEELGADIISLDAMKVYRGMDAGTAKPTAAELARVNHWMLSYLDVSETSSMGKFLERAEGIIRKLHQKNVPIICDGGSIMYVKGLVEGVLAGPGRDECLRTEFLRIRSESGTAALHRRLAEVDPVAAAKIGVNDYQRIERALEVYALTGQPISSRQTQWGSRREDLDIRLVGVRRERAVIEERIKVRTQMMLDAGWIDECRELLTRDISKEALMAHGYRAVFAYLHEEVSYEEMVNVIHVDTRKYAMRQLRSFARFPGIAWVDVTPDKTTEELADEVTRVWHCMEPTA